MVYVDKGVKGFSSPLKKTTPYINMINSFAYIPAVTVLCVAPAIANDCETCKDPVQFVQKNIDLINDANKVLDEVKDAAAIDPAIRKLDALTGKATMLDKCMAKVKLDSDQAIKITKMNAEAQSSIVALLENCSRLQKAKLMPDNLTKAINQFAAAANIQIVETITTVEEIIED